VTDATLRIKNLSIAFEAISRVNCEGSEALQSFIYGSLYAEIAAFKKEQNQESAKPTSLDDELPF
jgi:hypothetical protein